MLRKAGVYALLTPWLYGLLVLLVLTRLCSAEIVDEVVAVVNDEPITLSMLEDAMKPIWPDEDPPSESYESALQELIDHKLMIQEARKLGTDVIVSEERLSRELAEIASQFPSPEAASEAMLEMGISQEDLEEYLIEKIMIQEMIERKFLLFVEVNDIGASEYFEHHKEDFVIPEKVLLDRIFFPLAPDANEATREIVKKEAEEVYENLKGVGRFEDYASEERDMGYVSVDQLIPVVAAEVEMMTVGRISDLIQTPAGYFIIKLKDRRPERQAAFEDVKNEIKQNLRQQEAQADLNAWLKRQREVADIRILIEQADNNN